MFKKSVPAVFSALLLFSAFAHAEVLEKSFVTPQGWKAIPSPDNRLIAFQTAEMKEDSLMVVVRPINANGQSPQKWAEDEVSAISQQGFKLVEAPAEKTAGPNTFVRMVSWNDLAGFGLRNEQYFTSYPQTNGVLEVAILGPDPLWEAQRANIDAFLNSFRFN